MSDAGVEQEASILGVAHSRPTFAVPTGACDCHTHIFGPVERFPFAMNRTYTPGNASVEDLVALQRTLRLNRVVIVQPSPYGSDNRCTLDALRRLGERARGVAVIDERTSDTELEEMHRVGIRGVRVNLESAGEHDPSAAQRLLRSAATRVAPLGWHVQVYTSLQVIASLRGFLEDLPVPIAFDHYGLAHAEGGTKQPGFEALTALVREGCAYVKLSAPHRISTKPDYADVARIAQALVEANPSRTLWGSDWPHPGAWPGIPRNPAGIERFHPVDDGMSLQRLSNWLGDSAILRQVLVDNPVRLYQFQEC